MPTKTPPRQPPCQPPPCQPPPCQLPPPPCHPPPPPPPPPQAACPAPPLIAAKPGVATRLSRRAITTPLMSNPSPRFFMFLLLAGRQTVRDTASCTLAAGPRSRKSTRS